MRNIKLILEYDGSSFSGFQRQPRHLTIQEVLETALSRLFNRKMKIVAASGRTDSGVHASHQVVNFKTSKPIALEKIQRALNGMLPRSIAVRKIEEVPAVFHARYSATSKTYEYRIWNDPVRSALVQRAWQVQDKLDLRPMRRAVNLLKGRHDFRSFCAATVGNAKKNTIRTIKKFEINRQGPLIVICVEANGFLYHMVRNLVGLLVDLGKGKLKVSAVKDILNARDRRKAPATASCCGLMLVDVRYSK